MYVYRLNEITFNDGTPLEAADLVVLIGPNNSGKSRALRDIVELATKTSSQCGPTMVVNGVRPHLPGSLDELLESYGHLRRTNHGGNWLYSGLAPNLIGNAVIGGPPLENRIKQFDSEDKLNANGLFNGEFGKGLVGILTTEDRLHLVKQRADAAGERRVEHLLEVLYDARTEGAREISTTVSEAFPGHGVALDFSSRGNMSIRVASDFSDVPADPRDAKPVMAAKLALDDQGDGLRSFVGIAVALKAVQRPLFLIDEPEAFMAPDQAYAIGRLIASECGPRRQMIVTTHSTDVLRGILSKGQTVAPQIVRIDRVDNENTFKTLTGDSLAAITGDPLLNSARVLEGLFYDGAIVTEGDRDSRFCEAAIEHAHPGHRYHFVNAPSKQAVPTIMGIYREAGVRHVGIVDFDMVRDPADLENALNAIGLGDDALAVAMNARSRIAGSVQTQNHSEVVAEKRRLHQEIGSILAEIDGQSDDKNKTTSLKHLNNLFRKAARIGTDKWRDLKIKGRDALSTEAQASFEELSSVARSKGLFILPCGELESILSDCGFPHSEDKREWFRNALVLLPTQAVDESRKVWKLVADLVEYLSAKPRGAE